MPGKAQVPLSRYRSAFAAAVEVFGRGQVSTYILAGLGDTAEAILAMSRDLVALGVLSLRGALRSDLRHAAGEPPATDRRLHAQRAGTPLAGMLVAADLRAGQAKAGCGKCGACSALSTYERRLVA